MEKFIENHLDIITVAYLAIFFAFMITHPIAWLIVESICAISLYLIFKFDYTDIPENVKL